MKRTNLELVQDILSALDSDEVNTINDTTESQQVLRIVRNCYYDIAETCNLPRDYTLFQLTASGDNDKPVTMTIPDNIGSVNWVKYNVETTEDTNQQFRFVKYLTVEDFLAIVSTLDEDDTTVETYDYTNDHNHTLTFMCRNDKAPDYYTSFNDGTILFDSFDNTVDTTLQQSKTQCYGIQKYDWEDSDSFIAPLDDKQHQLLLHEAKSLAFAELKQTQHVKAEQSARRLKIVDQQEKDKIKLKDFMDDLPDYGRR